MEFGIAARQPAKIAVARRRLVGERRKEAKLRPEPAPAIEYVRIEKRKGDVPRDGDALRRRAQGRERRSGGPLDEISSGRAEKNRIHVAMRGDESGDSIEQGVEAGDLLRLHEAEVALRQVYVHRARQCAEDGNPKRFDRFARQPLMARAGDAIEDRAGDFDARIIGRAALDHGRRRLRLAAHVDAEQHRPAELSGDVGRGARSPRRAGDAVEKPHRALAEHEIASAAAPCLASRRGERAEKFRGHRPAVEIDA